MTYRLSNVNHEHFARQGFYLCHGKHIRTLAVLGMQPMLRKLKIDGMPETLEFEWQAECFDKSGRSLGVKHYRTPGDEELVFESDAFFSENDASLANEKIIGYVRLSISAVLFQTEPNDIGGPPRNFNGLLAIYDPGKFVTGVHMYHEVTIYPLRVVVLHYLKQALMYAIQGVRNALLGREKALWEGDAIGAVAVHASDSSRGAGLVVFHNDNWYPGLFSRMQFRNESNRVATHVVPNLRPAATYGVANTLTGVSSSLGNGWAQALCINPPLGMSRFLAGEEFSDGSFTLDHAYFQQPRESKWGKEREVRFFSRRLLDDSILGPSNPWYCAHDDNVESLVAISNQFHPDNEYRYDLLVFSEEGTLVLRDREFCIVPPWGFVVPSVSDALTRHGISSFRGTYALTYSSTNLQEVLPSRIHVQGIYRFRDGYWNGVQSDSSIWSTPRNSIQEIENLSSAKVRRRQLWYAPVIESEDIETLISVANLSYSLDYDTEQTLTLSYCKGAKVIAERDVTLRPFGSALISVREMFGEHMEELAGRCREYAEVMIYPKNGTTYCASYMIRDKRSGKFFLEHHLPVPKFSHEI